MDQKYKTLIPLIIIFFIFGIAVGYAVHKPETIEKIVTVTVTPTPTPPPTLTQPTPTPSPTLTSTPITTDAPTVSDFIVKDYYDPSTDIPTKTIAFQNYAVVPNQISIHPGDSVLIKITQGSLPFSLTLVLNKSYQKYLGGSGVAFVTFNKRGIYSVEGIIPSGDPNILPKIFATGTITVY